jgi:hypothetical protein
MGSVAALSSAGFDLVCSFPSDLQFSLELQLDSIGVCSSSADSLVSKHMLDFELAIDCLCVPDLQPPPAKRIDFHKMRARAQLWPNHVR